MVPRPLSEPLVLPGGRFQVPNPSLGPHWAPQLLVGLLRPTWWPPICPHFPLEVPDLPCPTLPPPSLTPLLSRTQRWCGPGTPSAWPSAMWWWMWGANMTPRGTATTITRGEALHPQRGDHIREPPPRADPATPQVFHPVHAEPPAQQALDHQAEQRWVGLLPLWL